MCRKSFACLHYLIEKLRRKRRKNTMDNAAWQALCKMLLSIFRKYHKRYFLHKDKSAHNEISDFYAHMALTYERHFARCFCRYSGNIAMRYFLSI